MKTLFTFAATLISLLLLASCASLTKEECLASDWQVIGERDGESGHAPQNQFRRHITACEKVNVKPDHRRWNAGYQQGLIRYCTPVKGLRVGQQGSNYHNVCPPHTERGFLRGYQLGQKEYQTNSRIRNLATQSDILSNEIEELQQRLSVAKPSDEINIKLKINQKRFERNAVTNSREDELFLLAGVQRLIDQFLRNPDG